MSEKDTFTYSFSLEEIKTLLLVLRECGESQSDELSQLQGLMQRHIYSIMTIEEAEKFFE